ncbi:MAG: cyclic nucleotide-binding domain-containing protein, partial [Gallionella sp.]
VRKHIDHILTRLLADRFIAEVGAIELEEEVRPPQYSGRIPTEKVKEAMMSSQKFNKDMLVLAEIEIERRMELEQDLADTRAKLAQATSQLRSVSTKYDTLKEQVLLYKQGIEARIAEQQAQLVALSGKKQASLAEKEQLEQQLKIMRADFQHMQETIQQKSARLDETVQARVLHQKQAEFEKRKKQKKSDDEMVQTHPHFHEIRGLEFFKKFRNSDLAQILSWAEWIEVKTGEIIITEGETGISFFVIVSGKLGLIKGKRTIQFLHVGEPFGEIAYLSDDAPIRTATVVARTECTLLKLNPAYLEDADLMIRVLFAESFMRVQARRLRTTVDMLGNLLVEGAE